MFCEEFNRVVMAGSELSTGNNFIMTAASLSKEVKWTDTLNVWIVCFIYNIWIRK